MSGIVMDAADAAPIGNATLVLQYSEGQLSTRTDAAGVYAFSFRASHSFQVRYRVDLANALGLLAVSDGTYWGDIARGHWTTVQLLPGGSVDVVQNVRLRPVRTLAPGQSMRVSVEADSSLAWDAEWDPWEYPSFDILREEFLVPVQTDGILTIDVRPEAGSSAATLMCPYVGCPDSRAQGTVSIPVEARWAPLHFGVEIRRGSAPQRYEVQASLR